MVGKNMPRELRIVWQRLVDEEGRTCERCSLTEQALEESLRKLQAALCALDISVVLQKESIQLQEFKRDPLQSNQIWINGRPIEQWLGATVGQSQCCSVCAGSSCRTLTVDGVSYEAIPSGLIVRAALLAAAELLGSAPGAYSSSERQQGRHCCCTQ